MAFEDLKDIVSPHWNDLPYEQKEAYKNRAKGTTSTTTEERKPVLPQKPEEARLMLIKEKERTMMEEVRELVQNAFDLGSEKFFKFLKFGH